MEGFTIPATDTDWPDRSFFADPKDIEDVDGVLEGTSEKIGKADERAASLIRLFLSSVSLMLVNIALTHSYPCSRRFTYRKTSGKPLRQEEFWYFVGVCRVRQNCMIFQRLAA